MPAKQAEFVQKSEKYEKIPIISEKDANLILTELKIILLQQNLGITDLLAVIFIFKFNKK